MPPAKDNLSRSRDRSLATKDVETAMQIVSSVCDPQSSALISDRRAELCKLLATHVDADVWFGSVGVWEDNDPVNSRSIASYDGGFLSDEERRACQRLLTDERLNDMVSQEIVRAFELGDTLTYRRKDVVSDKEWHESPTARLWSGIGFGCFLRTIHPMPNRYYSALRLHRRTGKPAFKSRDRSFVHMVWTQANWLHLQERIYPVAQKVVDRSVGDRTGCASDSKGRNPPDGCEGNGSEHGHGRRPR